MTTLTKTKTISEPIFVTLETAARLLACGKTTLYGYVKAADLHIVHHGKRSVLAMAELRHLAARLAAEAGVKEEIAQDDEGLAAVP